MSSYSRAPEEVSPRVLQSIIRNCQSYFDRHEDHFDRREYVQNLANLHRINADALWFEIVR